VSSEKQFAVSHAAFWHSLMPMAEEYLRTRNRMLTHYAPAIQSLLPAETRGIINELGYRLYVGSLELRVSVTELPEAFRLLCFEGAVGYVHSLGEFETTVPVPPLQESIQEATHLGSNIARFFTHAMVRTRFKIQTVGVAPSFPGCGWLNSSVGDFLSSKLLIEVKAGDRNFRGIDLRQVLIYCALNFASKTYDIAHICLLNPRLGVFLGEPLERLCQEISGRAASEILEDIVQFVSEPSEAYPAN
jgi:hypothetical protein